MQKRISNEWSDSDKILLDKVFEYKNGRRFAEGLRVLKTLNKRIKNDRVIAGLMATFYYEQKKYKYSARYFKKTTVLSPHSELASLGLFHSLVHINKFSLAVKELKRYVSGNKIRLYKITIKELRQNITNYNSAGQKLIRSIKI